MNLPEDAARLLAPLKPVLAGDRHRDRDGKKSCSAASYEDRNLRRYLRSHSQRASGGGARSRGNIYARSRSVHSGRRIRRSKKPARASKTATGWWSSPAPPIPASFASRLEDGAEKSYSIHTIERVQAATPGEVFFIIGADAFAEIRSWHRWRDVIASVDFIVVARPGHDYICPPRARVHRLETVALPVSSSEIRHALARGETPADLPPAVVNYIREHRLYGAA